MSEEKRSMVVPVACFCHDDKGYAIDVELPGVDKKHIEVSISGQSLCVAGSRDEFEYVGCWTLAHELDEDKADAKYENGLLRMRIPFKKPVEGRKIKVT